MITGHAPVTATQADPTYIGCVCRRFEAQVTAPADRPAVWSAHARAADVPGPLIVAAVACSAMAVETFGGQG